MQLGLLLRRLRYLPVAMVLSGASLACGSDVQDELNRSDGGSNDGGSQDSTVDGGAPLTELPWEVVSEQGETYLPNMFYADSSQTEQIMPLTVDGRLVIDRLIYPTLGNPNLVTKDDPNDSLVVVLRLEQSVLDKFNPTETRLVPGHNRHYLDLAPTADSQFAYYLIARSARETFAEYNQAIPGADGTSVVRIEPTELQIDPITPDMPEALRARRTVRVVFRGAQLAATPPGLYDLRFEAKQNKRLIPAPSSTGAPAGGAVYEWQYNAVRVFGSGPTNDAYSVINVTDTQYSLGTFYAGKTKERLDDFVSYVNLSTDPAVRNAAFITFNGDLHNGGSPTTLRQNAVASTYNAEAKGILNTLKWLRVPIFLTAGNHDGYSSTGIAPGAVKSADNLVGTSMDGIVQAAEPKAWPNFSLAAYQSYVAQLDTAKRPGGFERDLFTGSFQRFAGARTFKDGWKELPREARNMVLYDGFNQWQRTYGPLNSSFKFGKNFYINMNSFELRQHTRSGWGMYTVSYGGGLSAPQMEWVRREVDAHPAEDVVLLAHHDPRGGHNGADPGYYFAPLAFRGMGQSTVNYLIAEVWNPQVCKLPSWALSDAKELGCLHDGLQEWMGPETAFDCKPSERKADGKCDATLFRDGTSNYYRFSAFDLIDLVATHPNVRTYLLGHTHYNSYEMLQSGAELAPTAFSDEQLRSFANLEVQNPSRGYAWQQEQGDTSGNYDPETLQKLQLDARAAELKKMYEGASKLTQRKLQGDRRELAVLRTTSAADLTSQKVQGASMFGFAVFQVAKRSDSRGYTLPQINTITYLRNLNGDQFGNVATIDVNRTQSVALHGANNPLSSLFQ